MLKETSIENSLRLFQASWKPWVNRTIKLLNFEGVITGGEGEQINQGSYIPIDVHLSHHIGL